MIGLIVVAHSKTTVPQSTAPGQRYLLPEISAVVAAHLSVSAR